jgi:hypothetical protein
MKYIITESRLNDIIESYLNSELGDLKLVNINEKTDWYVNKSGKPLVIISHGSFKDIVMLRRDINNNLKNMFGLDTTDDLQANLRKYFYMKWGLPVEMVYTFELSNEDMVD